MSRIVVIGANHAGTAAINTILDNYPREEVTVIDRNTNISFLGCGMALWIGGQIDGPEGLFYSSPEKFLEKKARVLMETEAESIDWERKVVQATKKDGERVEVAYDKLILATGSLPVKLDIPGIQLENIQYVKLYQDAEKAIQTLNRPGIESVAVVGAGYIGVELAEAFRRCGKKVTLIDRLETCLSKYYDPEFTRDMEENLEKHGIVQEYGRTVLEFKGKNRVESVVTDRGEIPADMVVIAGGFIPNTCLAGDKLRLFDNRAFLVDRHQETSERDVYAIGDCATVYDNALQKTSYIALASNAVRSGIVAAHNACGTPLGSEGVQGSNGISIYGYHMVSTGLTFQAAKASGFSAGSADWEDLQRPGFMKNNHPVKIRIVYDRNSRRILGAQMASREDISMGIHLFSLAVQEQVTIDKLKLMDIFFLPHFNQPYNYITMAALNAK